VEDSSRMNTGKQHGTKRTIFEDVSNQGDGITFIPMDVEDPECALDVKV